MATDSHDQMIEAFQKYFKWQERFEYHGSDEAGIKARFWLSDCLLYTSPSPRDPH